MSDVVTPLVADLVSWIAREPRLYADVLDAWRTSCPRLPVWEEALERGYVRAVNAGDRARVVVVTEEGRVFLAGRQ